MIAEAQQPLLLGRMAGRAAVVAVLVGLPVAVQVTDMKGAFATAQVLAHAVTKASISTPVRISDRLPLTLDAGRIRPEGGAVSEDGRMPVAIVVEDAALTLDLSQRAAGLEPKSEAQEPNAPLLPLIAGLASGTMRLARARLTMIGPEGGRYVLSNVNATLTVSRKGSYKLAGTGEMRGQHFNVDAIWSDSAARDPDAQLPLKLAIAGDVIELTLDGLVKTGSRPVFAGDAEARIANFGQFAGWLDLGTGLEGMLKSIVISGALEWGPSQMMFTKATINVDGKPASGALTLRHGGERPAIDATLGFAEFDLSRIISGRLSEGPRRIAVSSGKAHILSAIDADLRLSAARLTGAPVELGRGAVSIAVNRGRIQADMAELDIEGGIGVGQLTVDLNQPDAKASVKLKVRDIDVGHALAGPIKRNALLGRANVSFEGSSHGKSIAEAAATLTGRGQLDITKPARLGLDITALMHAARGGPVTGWVAAGKGSTPIDTLSGRFRVIDGAFTVEGMQARSGSTVLNAQGQFDVPGRLVDMSIGSSPADAQVSMEEVLLLRGTWEAPDISLKKRDAKVDGAPAQN
ncbi:MAG: AsmA family protein [Proteobacteria bacterium]|nr:AsmA family protein [Pseudomonadota bacterium]